MIRYTFLSHRTALPISQVNDITIMNTESASSDPCFAILASVIEGAEIRDTTRVFGFSHGKMRILIALGM